MRCVGPGLGGGMFGGSACSCVVTQVLEDGRRRPRGTCPELGLGPCGSLWLVHRDACRWG